MAIAAGKDADFEVGGSLISVNLTSINGPNIDGQVAETSTIGDTYKSYLRTQTDPGGIDCEGIYDNGIGTFLANMGTAAAQTFVLHPQGSAAGNTEFSGSALLTSFVPPIDRDDAVTFSASFQVTGDLTIGTVGA